MNADTASGRTERTLDPPWTSTSSTTTRPARTPSSTGPSGVPYRCPCTSAHSRNTPWPRRRSNSSRVTNSYSTPSASVGRRGRVVHEIENTHSGRAAISRSTSVPLPAPEGPDTTNTKPPGSNRGGASGSLAPVASSGSTSAFMRGSLDVLNLLAQALDLFLDHDHRAGDRDVVGL